MTGRLEFKYEGKQISSFGPYVDSVTYFAQEQIILVGRSKYTYYHSDCCNKLVPEYPAWLQTLPVSPRPSRSQPDASHVPDQCEIILWNLV